MAVVHALDNYYLAITLLITIAYQLFFFSIAYTLQFDKLTGKLPGLGHHQDPSSSISLHSDFAGGTNFVVLAIITFVPTLLYTTAHSDLNFA